MGTIGTDGHAKPVSFGFPQTQPFVPGGFDLVPYPPPAALDDAPVLAETAPGIIG
ncbi:hypothetical protein GCM10027570_11790 [Streptomonospora sediminis]